MSPNCHYGCYLGRRCLGITRAEAIEQLQDKLGESEAYLSGLTDSQLDACAESYADVDFSVQHVRRTG